MSTAIDLSEVFELEAEARQAGKEADRLRDELKRILLSHASETRPLTLEALGKVEELLREISDADCNSGILDKSRELVLLALHVPAFSLLIRELMDHVQDDCCHIGDPASWNCALGAAYRPVAAS